MEEVKNNDDVVVMGNDANKRRIKKGVFVIGLTAILLMVSTYAWFVGLTNVGINEFELNVEATKGLQLSLDGSNFSNTLTINQTTLKDDLATSYASNTNNWIDEGLVPMSSVGLMNTTTSRMNIFAKSSMTANKGGYKLIASLANQDAEVDGYIAFDLFIKNDSGSYYDTAFNTADDEGIYLVPSSSAIIEPTGEGVSAGGDGIENSLRVAFMQIGRVPMNSDATKVQGISCGSNAESGVTQLCTQAGGGRGITWNIWEPNDLKHNQESIQHFDKICFKRTGDTTYDGKCDAIADDTYINTFASNAEISSSDNINIYDGLNGYDSVSTKLTQMTYFRDSTDKANRNEIFYLAPSSITKVRVYIYIEGQDVDNYDLGSMGKKIYVNFGLSKNKFAEAK